MNSIRTYVCFVALCLAASPTMLTGQTQQLPISTYLDQLNSTYYTAWSDPASDRFLYFDTYGKRAKAFGLELGTNIEGSVMIRPLRDGKAHVTITVHTRNAVCWGFQGDFEGAYLPAFGYSPRLIGQAGAPASLGDGMQSFEFTMPTLDSPLTGNYPLESIIAVINCSGELRYGSGNPDGTPGKAHTTQKGLFNTGVAGGCPPEKEGDCFPSEIVRFWPTGK